MNRIQGVMTIYLREKWTWFWTPLIVLSSTLIPNLIISAFVDYFVSLTFIVASASLVYMFVTGIVCVPQTFSFAISMQVRRKDYFFGSSLMAAMISAGLTVISLILLLLERKGSNRWGLQFVDGLNIIELFGIMFVLFMSCFYIGLMISSAFQRFKAKGLLTVLVILILTPCLIALLAAYESGWQSLYVWLTSIAIVELVLWSIPISILSSLLSYRMLRRSSV
ncbi:hypothetical protein NQ117_15120 [Paenibacillus sp. SC116]|uniref:hypothetical protein n=1 Tax=Paenibacillus sp. SC116 TaxID=2968986 RepID=UPI00215B58F8|nr:hypothetical protein [Paenibacillus sp. SC116]MCR8845012.1 hypothetical protein [Paenibacillus sp. SC116]